MHEAQTKKVLNRDPGQLRRVRSIADRLIPATATFRTDAPGWRWETWRDFLERAQRVVHAGRKDGGLHTGLIDKLNLSDDELAAVMGHEIAHALREHGREKASQAAGLGVAAAIGGALIGSYYGVDADLGESVLGAAGGFGVHAS